MEKITDDKDNGNNNDNKKKEKINYQYKCEECGIDFGNSIGDMEEHKLTFHLQKGDIEIK
ncbi:MAG: hypothetical protein AB7F53_06895 [Nitrososphaeraceae archaeon]